MISVAMCTCNGREFAEEQLLSILYQTVPVDEVVICDDCSNDDTVEVLRGVAQRSKTCSTRIYVNDQRLGVTKNFEKALNLCEGDIVFLCDQDDIWLPNKVECLTALMRERNADMVFSDAVLVDSKGNSLGKTLWRQVGVVPKDQYSLYDCIGTRFVTGATACVRRRFAASCLPIPKCWIHDAWFATNAAINHRLVACGEKLTLYRQHDRNVIGAGRTIGRRVAAGLDHPSRYREFKTTMLERMKTLLELNQAKLSVNEVAAIEEAISFWQEEVAMSEVAITSTLLTILRHFATGQYRCYSSGWHNALTDIMLLLVGVG